MAQFNIANSSFLPSNHSIADVVIVANSSGGIINSFGGGSGGSSNGITVFVANTTNGAIIPTNLVDGIVSSQKATISVFHAADNQSPGNTAYGLLTGGVAQLLNPTGNIDRQRETGFDGISAAGVATGTQQLAGPLLTTTVSSGAITGNSINTQTVSLTNTYFINRGVNTAFQIGTTLLVDAGNANAEYVFVTNVSSTNVYGVFTKGHAAGVSVSAFTFNQARDATIPDGSTPAGIGASAAYLFNASNSSVEFERSFAGELMGAKGSGAAIAVEYEDSSGGPPYANGVVSGLRLFPAQSLNGIGQGTAAITSTTSGQTSIVFGSAAATNMISPGHAILLSGSGTLETVFVTQTWVPGSSATVPIQNPLVYTGQVTATWSQFASNGPGLNGFLPYGIGIEEEAVFDPVSNSFFIERSSTADAMAPQNIVAESGVIFNGTTFDRIREVVGDGQTATGIAAEAIMVWNGTTYDRLSGNTSGIKIAGGLTTSYLVNNILVADVVSAAITTTTTSTTFTPVAGAVSYSINIPVTAVSGTTPTLDVVVQESDDGGTNWFDVYHFPRITATGIYRSPITSYSGTRIRYVQTVGGTTPSFTRAINRDSSSITSNKIFRRIYDRAVSLTTLSATTASLITQGLSNIQMTINVGAITTTAPALQLQGSDDNGASWYSLGSPLTAVASSSVQTTLTGTQSELIRAIVTTAGVGVTAGYISLKAF